MISQKKSHTIWWKKCQLSSSLFYSTSSTLFHEAGLSRVTSVAEDRHVILLLLVRPSRGQHAAEMSTTYPCLCSARKWYNMWLLLAVMMWYVYNFHCEIDCVIIPIFHFEKSTVIIVKVIYIISSVCKYNTNTERNYCSIYAGKLKLPI